MKKTTKIIGLVILAISAILLITYLQVYSVWIMVAINMLLLILLFSTLEVSSTKWKICLISIIVVSFLIPTTSMRVKHLSDGKIRLVSAMYPICPKVISDGIEIDTITFRTGYSSYLGCLYQVRSERIYVIKNADKSTTIINFWGKQIVRGHGMTIEEYKGPHGAIDVFCYLDDDGKKVKYDYYGNNPDVKKYNVDNFDGAEYAFDIAQ